MELSWIQETTTNPFHMGKPNHSHHVDVLYFAKPSNIKLIKTFSIYCLISSLASVIISMATRGRLRIRRMTRNKLLVQMNCGLVFFLQEDALTFYPMEVSES